MFKCQFCPCVFLSQEDLDVHMLAFGSDGVAHNRMFVFLSQEFKPFEYGYIGYCWLRRKPVANTIINCILCSGCTHLKVTDGWSEVDSV